MSSPSDLNHKHIIVSAANLAAPPRTALEITQWLAKLVDLVGMKILMGPYAVRCETDGNEGVTGIVCIETSHASCHFWDTGCAPFGKMDLYSCKDFDVAVILNHFTQFAPGTLSYSVLDRNDPDDACVIEQGRQGA